MELNYLSVDAIHWSSFTSLVNSLHLSVKHCSSEPTNSLKIQWNHLMYKDPFCNGQPKQYKHNLNIFRVCIWRAHITLDKSFASTKDDTINRLLQIKNLCIRCLLWSQLLVYKNQNSTGSLHHVTTLNSTVLRIWDSHLAHLVHCPSSPEPPPISILTLTHKW
jgi:hypothetical protein